MLLISVGRNVGLSVMLGPLDKDWPFRLLSCALMVPSRISMISTIEFIRLVMVGWVGPKTAIPLERPG